MTMQQRLGYAIYTGLALVAMILLLNRFLPDEEPGQATTSKVSTHEWPGVPTMTEAELMHGLRNALLAIPAEKRNEAQRARLAVIEAWLAEHAEATE